MDAFDIIILHSKQQSPYWLSQLDDSKSIQIVCFTISIHRTLVCLEFQVNLLFARVQRWGPLFWGRCFEINGNVSKVDDAHPKSLGIKSA